MSEKPRTDFDTSVFDVVIDTGSADQRMSLTRQLSAFLSDAEAPAKERGAVVPAVVRLAVDPVIAIRKTLAIALARTPELHADILFTIASDCDEIALDFLIKTPALDVWHMMAIAKVGEPAKQAVIASRGDLSAQIINFIAETASADVVAKLLDNRCAALNTSHFKNLYVRFTDEPVVVDRLLERDDLPLEIRLMHVKRTSNRVYHLMAQRGWMAANDAEEFAIDAEENTFIQILEQASEGDLDRLIPFMCQKKLLTPSIILRAACVGDMQVVERALAYLASVPLKRVRSMAAGRGLKTLLNKAGMPVSGLALIRAAFDIARQARASSQDLSVEQFGCKVIEFVMTRYETVSAAEKTERLDMIAKFSNGRTRRIACRVQDDLQQAA